MKIIYLDHAKQNINDRKISKGLIEDALTYPDEIIESKKGRKIAQKIIGKKLLIVIYKENKNTYMAATSYYSEPDRYIKK